MQRQIDQCANLCLSVYAVNRPEQIFNGHISFANEDKSQYKKAGKLRTMTSYKI